MKLLFDQNLSFKLVSLLADLFPESNQVRQIGLDQADDDELWQYGKLNGFVLVSKDSDFADLAAFHGPPPKVIWLRCGNQPSSVIEARLRSNARLIEVFGQDPDAACLEIL